MKLDQIYILANKIVGRVFKLRVTRLTPSFEDARDLLISNLSVDLVVDGGANRGQWVSRLRSRNKSIDVFSFEPLHDAHAILNSNLKNDPNWKGFNFALGSKNEDMQINLSSNLGMSSSFLQPDKHLTMYPTVEFKGTENVSVRRLDSFSEILERKSIYLKLDVQGFEQQAIDGASALLPNISVIELETTFESMYTGEPDHYVLIPNLIELGFRVFSVSEPAKKPNGQCTYIDVLLVRNPLFP